MSDARTATEIFEQHADGYQTRLRRQLIGPFDAFYGTAVGALRLAAQPPARILDLGAGTGMLSRLVMESYPEAEIVLQDGSGAMLDQARAHLGDRVSYVESDMTDPLPPGPWGAIVSALAIHHLDDDGKRDLYARVHNALLPGGVFVNAEQVAGPTALFADLYRRRHHEEAVERGITEEEWQATLERMRLDRWATAERQMAWLREAGFGDVDCLFKDHQYAVLVARR